MTFLEAKTKLCKGLKLALSQMTQVKKTLFFLLLFSRIFPRELSKKGVASQPKPQDTFDVCLGERMNGCQNKSVCVGMCSICKCANKMKGNKTKERNRNRKLKRKLKPKPMPDSLGRQNTFR